MLRPWCPIPRSPRTRSNSPVPWVGDGRIHQQELDIGVGEDLPPECNLCCDSVSVNGPSVEQHLTYPYTIISDTACRKSRKSFFKQDRPHRTTQPAEWASCPLYGAMAFDLFPYPCYLPQFSYQLHFAASYLCHCFKSWDTAWEH